MSKSETDHRMMEAECGMKCFEDEGSGLNQGVQGPPEPGQGREVSSSLKSLQGTQP